ncbi:MAG: hypothetical protein ACJZ4O_03580 [Pelagibacteraceae bacterium]
MRSLNLSKIFTIFLIFVFFCLPAVSEDQVDIWKKKKFDEKKADESSLNINETNLKKITIEENSIRKSEIIEISNESKEERELFGILDPGQNNLSLNMWKDSNGDDIKNIFKRINKINLSKYSEDLFLNTILTYSFSPEKNMTSEEFLELKIDWLIKNEKDDILEDFLNKNENFKFKKAIIQYLVDKNIAKANIKDGCKKVEFIGKDIKDSYLERFKIYCLIFNDKKNEAQLIFDILKEQSLSDKFFDDKINFLLGITNKTKYKIKDNNLLNFYLSSITVSDFNYQPTDKTDKFIWEYMDAANLLVIDNLNDKEKIKTLEIAAKNNTLDKKKIFEIYKKFPFELNSLINAEGIYQSLEPMDARALIYQKFLLADNTENKIKLLFLLKDLFKKDNLAEVYKTFMSDRLKEINDKTIPKDYVEVVEKNIISEEEETLGKIRYDDKILHRSRVLRYYTEEGTPVQKTQKDIKNTYKKIKKNKNYFFSAKDLALMESLEIDGFEIPNDIKLKDIATKYNVPDNLLSLIQNNEIGLLSLKFVEIIGEDEINELDSETVYFIINLLNKAKLTKFRNKAIITALPQRI